MKWLQRSELLYILYTGGFAFIFFALVIPFLINRGIEQTNPILQFLIFNVGIFVLLSFYFKAKSLGRKVDWGRIFETLIIFLALDIWIPPLLVSLSGELLGAGSVILFASSTDYIVGMIWQSMGMKGFMLFLSTYFLTPTLLLFLAAKVNKSFVRKI